MLKKTISFEDFDGNPVTEDWYFNLTKAELAEMVLTHEGGDLRTYLQEIVKAENAVEVLSTFRKIISMAVGQRSEDGRRFIKKPEITADFMESNAYSELFMELMQDNGASLAEFLKAIIPSDLAETVDEVSLPDDREYTDDELLEMSDSEFARVAGTDPKDMTKRHLQLAYQRKSHRRAS